ncbi:restriction endonuclease subunit S [Psittacicella gerlachiana]|uniref:Type I restriction modification DNA specificity domain-containing protein n=1 Tax=Psittacicella gerlachiana TaxID=2028574 RepID=A0A3A1Y8M2_9GAMM|nr:restriction endonuclease subunit S [Psittacicella gerlachiana]RIY32467.1 hypothetical protein CKF59_06935 [Psittacicella gerlachiana]
MNIPELRFTNFNTQWLNVKLKDCVVRSNKRNKELKYSFVESIISKQGFIPQAEAFEGRVIASKDLSNYSVVTPCSFAFNPGWIQTGALAYKSQNSKISIISPLYVVFKTTDLIDDYFLWYWFLTDNFEQQRSTETSTGVRFRFNFESLIAMKINLPSIDEQKKIGHLFKIEFRLMILS